MTFEQLLPLRKLLPYRRFKWDLKFEANTMFDLLYEMDVVNSVKEYGKIKDEVFVRDTDEHKGIRVDNVSYLKNCAIWNGNHHQFLVYMKVDKIRLLLHFDCYKGCNNCRRHYWEDGADEE